MAGAASPPCSRPATSAATAVPTSSRAARTARCCSTAATATAASAARRRSSAAAGRASPRCSGPGDFSGDGKVDVLARQPDGTLLLYRGSGAGGWLRQRPADRLRLGRLHRAGRGRGLQRRRPARHPRPRGPTARCCCTAATARAASSRPIPPVGAGWQSLSFITLVGQPRPPPPAPPAPPPPAAPVRDGRVRLDGRRPLHASGRARARQPHVRKRKGHRRPRVVKVVFFVRNGPRRVDRKRPYEVRLPLAPAGRLQGPRLRAGVLPPRGDEEAAQEDGGAALCHVRLRRGRIFGARWPRTARPPYIVLMATSKWTPKDLTSQAGRTFVVTGANSGIGLAAARELAAAGARVVLAVRDRQERGRAAAERSTASTEVRRLDLADLASVRAFADAWTGDLDVLDQQRRRDGGPRAAHRRRLRDADRHQPPRPLRADQPAAAARSPTASSTVASGAHRMGAIDLDDLNWERRGYHRWRAYGQSKLANLLFTLELQRRLRRGRLAACAPSPRTRARRRRTSRATPATSLQHVGMCGRQQADRPERRAGRAADAVRGDAGPRRATATSARTASRRAAATRRSSGRSGAARDDEVARRLWELSEELTGVRFPLAPVSAA